MTAAQISKKRLYQIFLLCFWLNGRCVRSPWTRMQRRQFLTKFLWAHLSLRDASVTWGFPRSVGCYGAWKFCQLIGPRGVAEVKGEVEGKGGSSNENLKKWDQSAKRCSATAASSFTCLEHWKRLSMADDSPLSTSPLSSARPWELSNCVGPLHPIERATRQRILGAQSRCK